MATITAGIKNWYRIRLNAIDNGAARFLKDHDGNVANNAKTWCVTKRASRHVHGVAVDGLVYVTRQMQASPRYETVV